MSALIDISKLNRKNLARCIGETIGMEIFKAQTPHTMKSYLSTTQYWLAWHYVRFNAQLELPVPVDVVIQFIADHAALGGSESQKGGWKLNRSDERSGGQVDPEMRFANQLPAELDDLLNNEGLKRGRGHFSFNTLRHHLSVLSFIHRELWLKDNPCKDTKVRELLAIVQSKCARDGVRAHRLTPFTQQALNSILATCDESIVGKRDRALLLFAWEGGGRRRSEVVSATIKDLRKVSPQNYIYSFTSMHANRETTREKNLTGDAADALNAWLQIRGTDPGPIFKRIFRSGRISNAGLRPGRVRMIVKERCRKAGLPDDYSAHSLRSGFLFDAGRRNLGLLAAMKISDHQNYFHAASYFPQEYLAGSMKNLFLDFDSPN